MKETKMMIYGAGGAGINVVQRCIEFWGESKYEVDRVCNYNHAFIDTSSSNVKKGMNEDNVYILPNLDGSGKKRDENHLEISNVIKEVLVKHKPLDFNIVLFSLSGGSGSVIAPLLISELLSRNIPVIAVCIGSDESVLTANNTLKTLKSLEVIAKKNDKALNFIYQYNERGMPRGKADKAIEGYLSGFRFLFSGKNEELDSQDLINWLDFTKTTSLSPQLGLLEVYSSSDDVVANHPNPVSVASLYTDKDVHGLTAVPEYHCAGYTDLTSCHVDQLHFVIDVKDVPTIAKKIDKTLNQQKEVAESRLSQNNLVSSKDKIEDSGLIL